MHFSVLFICAFKVQNNFLTNGLCNKFFLTCKDRNVALLMNNLFHKCHTPYLQRLIVVGTFVV